jgi:hypothetical protein
MKKTHFLLFIAMASLLVSCDDERVVEHSALPQKSQIFLETHFGDYAIGRVIRDRRDRDSHWEVTLVNGWQIDFRRNGEWDSIDTKWAPIPESVFRASPATSRILDFCNEHHPGDYIIEIDREFIGFEVELRSGMELIFNSQGGFIRRDR